MTVLLFAARRLRHDAVAVILARRDNSPDPDLSGINEFRLSGLTPTDSAALLSDRKTNPAVLERLVKDTAGNPLALLEAAGNSARNNSAARRRCQRCCPSAAAQHRLPH